MSTHLLATVHIPIVEALQRCAERLTGVLDDIAFVVETSGKYEEVPAFVGSRGAAQFVLFGVPEAEAADGYTLEFRCDTTTPIRQLATELGISFLDCVPDDKPRNARGYVDVSPELCAYLNDADFAPSAAVVSN